MPNQSTNLNIRMDAELKIQAEQLFSELGMNMTTAFNIFVRQSIRSGGLPFEVKLNPVNTETLNAMDDVRNRRNLSKSFSSVASLMEDLNAEN